MQITPSQQATKTTAHSKAKIAAPAEKSAEPAESFQRSQRTDSDLNIGKGLLYGVLGGAAGAIPLVGGLATGLGATLATEAATNNESERAKLGALGAGTLVGTTLNVMGTAALARGNWLGLGLLGAANAVAYFYAGSRLPNDY